MSSSGNCDYCWCLSFSGFLRPDLTPGGYRNRWFLVALCRLFVRNPNIFANLMVKVNSPLIVALQPWGSWNPSIKRGHRVFLNACPSSGKNTRVACHVTHGSVSLQLFPVVWIFPRSLGVICYGRWVLSEGHKNYFKDWCLMNSQSACLLLTNFKFYELWPCY